MDFGGTLFSPVRLVCTPGSLVISSLTLPPSYSATSRAGTLCRGPSLWGGQAATFPRAADSQACDCELESVLFSIFIYLFFR